MGDMQRANTHQGSIYKIYTSVAIVLESDNNSIPIKVVLN